MKKAGCKKIRVELAQTFPKAIEATSKFMDDHPGAINAWDASLLLAYIFPDLEKEDTLCHLINYRDKK
jgi:hypothetical protein